MSIPVTVVDYGMGNLLSVTRALEYCGATVLVTNSPSQVERAEWLVVPGVGAFANGMEGLRARGLDTAIVRYARAERKLLGICLGMQMLLSESEEFGLHPGLGLIPGKVVAIPGSAREGRSLKIPHIGWNGLSLPPHLKSWQGSILEGIVPGQAGYFIHSYAVVPEHASHRLAECRYGENVIVAAIRDRAVYGTQFHPEKSGDVGLKILKRFLQE